MVQLKALSSISFPVWHILGFWIYAAVLTHMVCIMSALISGWKTTLWLGGEEKGMVVFPVQTLTACLLPTLQAIPLFFLLCVLNTADKSLTYFSASSAV